MDECFTKFDKTHELGGSTNSKYPKQNKYKENHTKAQ